MARGRCYMWFFLQMRRQVQGGKEKTAIVFAYPALMTAVEWRCGPPAGEHWARRQYEWLRQVWCVWALLCATGTAFKIAHQKPLGSLLCSLEKFCVDVLLYLQSADKNFYAPALAFFARAYLAVKADDLCTVFTLEFMCYCDKAGGVVCVSMCNGLWVFIETADCRMAYWRTQTIFRGNAKFHEFPIPLLISSVPTWVMHVVLCTIWPPHRWWPFANCMRLVACCRLYTWKGQNNCKWLSKTSEIHK